MTKEQQEKYQLNIALGNDFDTLLNSLSGLGLTKKQAIADMKILTGEQAGKAYESLTRKFEVDITG